MSQTDPRVITNAERKTVALYMLFVFGIGGGVGVYFPLFVDRQVSAESLATYAIAALAPLGADMLYLEKYWISMTLLDRMKIGFMSAISVLIAGCSLFRYEKPFDMTLAIISALIVIWLLYRIIILSGKFRPEVTPRTEDGGPAIDLTRLQGGGLQ